MKINLTPEARERLQMELERGSYMRVDITRSGCCGGAITIMPAMRKPDDVKVEADGLSLAVSKDANEFLRNITIDYKRKGLRKGFHIQPA